MFYDSCKACQYAVKKIKIILCYYIYQIPELGIYETIVDGGWWSEDIIAILSSTGKFILLPFKTMEIIEAENFKIPSIFIPSPIKSIFVLEVIV